MIRPIGHLKFWGRRSFVRATLNQKTLSLEEAGQTFTPTNVPMAFIRF